MDNRWRRTHPISIFFFLSRFLYLLLIPLLRGLTALFTGGLLAWISGAWLDLLILFLIVILAHQHWLQFKYYTDDNSIHYTIGIFYRQVGAIPFRHVSTLSIQQHFWLRPIRVVKLRVDTLAMGKGKADLQLFLHRAEAQRILRLHPHLPADITKLPLALERPRTHELLFLSFFTSNSLLGILFLSTFISQAGRMFGSYLSDLLSRYFMLLADQFAPVMTIATILFQIPPIATALALLLLGGWLIAFTVNLLQVKNLQVARYPNGLLIQGGLLTRKTYSVPYVKISFVDVRQSLLTRVLRLFSVFLNAAGMGKERSDISAIIPFSTKRRCLQQLDALLPEYHPTDRSLKPNGGAIMKFILDPLWPCILIPLAAILGAWLLPRWAGIIRFLGLMLSIPAFWWLGVRLLDFVSSGVSRSGKYITMRYSEMYYLHTVVFSADKISLVNIRQSILQRTDKKCDLVVSTFAESGTTHHVRNLDWDGTAQLFDAEDDIPFVLEPSFWDHAVAFFQRLFSKKK